MIAANYTMHIYCDCKDCIQGRYKHNNGEAEFIGKSWADTARQARKAGWRISRDGTIAYAPNHKNKGGE